MASPSPRAGGPGPDDRALEEAIKATEKVRQQAQRDKLEAYSHLRNERDKATLTLMMKMNPRALNLIRKEFFVRDDALTVDEWLFVVNKHLINQKGEDDFVMENPDDREFGTQMYELFKDIDINGDGDLEWQEFTSFVVEKANLLNKRQKLERLPHYYDSSKSLDADSEYRHRNAITKIVSIPALHQFCITEDTKRNIWVFNSRSGRQIGTIKTDSAPISMSTLGEQCRGTLVASFADMTIATYSLDEPSMARRYQQITTFATPGVQMALQYVPASGLLYSGATNGNVYSWKMEERKMVKTLTSHTDIVMSLCLFDKLNYVASGSLDKTISLWDAYTESRIVHYHGHRKGVLELAYTPDYRLMFSCGFEHDCMVWSPFVNSSVFRLKGHHAALCGVQCVPNTPEVITGDITGVFKLWDVRKFECVQTFRAGLSGADDDQGEDDHAPAGRVAKAHLNCFVHTTLPPRLQLQKEDDSRIILASKLLRSFDQVRVVHEATTDYYNVICIIWVPEMCCFVTVSEKNVIVWDALIGCKNVINDNIIEGQEITAACLDDRKRKMVIGDVTGTIQVYNHVNGQFMKSASSGVPNPFPVIALEYLDEDKRFIAGYANGMVRVYDENAMEDCCVVRTLDYSLLLHPEMSSMVFNPYDRSLVTSGSNLVCFWDYDASKVVYELPVCSSTEAVVCVILLLPLPIVATSDSTGNITLWASRGHDVLQGMRLGGFLHQIPVAAELEPRPKKLNFYEKTEEKPRRALAPYFEPDPFPLDFGTQESDFDEAEGGEGAEAAQVSAKEKDLDKSMQSEEDEEDEEENNAAPSPHKRKKDPNEFDERAVDEERRAVQIAELTAEASAAQNKWGRLMPASTMAWDEASQRIYTGDDVGTLRCFGISHLLQDCCAAILKEGHPEGGVRGLCAQRGRNGASALAPAVDPSKPTLYQLADIASPNAYFGVDFVWGLEVAHADRIVRVQTTNQGVLSSGADKLVKMWTFDGLVIGVLLQSVPTGQPSAQWQLDHDVDGILLKEEDDLNGLIETVKELAAPETEKPNIWEADYDGMEPGKGSADFTRSELRQRIDQTSQKLGLEFPVEEGDEDEGDGEGLEEDQQGVGQEEEKSALFSALEELRSTRGDVEAQATKKRENISEVAKRRQEKKFEDVALKYEHIAGIVVKAGQTSFGGEDEEGRHLDAIISVTSSTQSHKKSEQELFSVEYSMQSSVGPEVVDLVLRTKRSAGSKLNDAIEKTGSSGVRSQKIAQKMKQYKTFKSLEKALVQDDPLAVLTQKPSKEAAAQLKISNKMKFLLEEK